MKVLFDTNIWLDVALNREPFQLYSYAALAECIDSGDNIYIAATSLKDVFYICSRASDSKSAYKAIQQIFEIAKVSTIDEAVCIQALPLEKPDYEDGIIAASAIIENHDLIITRDTKAFKSLEIQRLTPQEFLTSRGYKEIALTNND